ncbi:MAG TPA: hypothetical protein VFR14_06370 [Candidatus Limnocylindrales bacterium]|nr:hypothetical protein [Candidatus Limnocylindrales bacterium]
MVNLTRRTGIVLGSLVAAWLVVWLVGGATVPSGLAGLIVFVLGGLIYQDIVRREDPRPR